MSEDWHKASEQTSRLRLQIEQLSKVCSSAIAKAGITNCHPDEARPVVEAVLAAYRLNLVKDEPIIRDDRWEILVTNVGDFGFEGKLCVRHRQRGTWDEWPGSESDNPPPVTARGYDLEHEITFPTLAKAIKAAETFLKRWGTGEVEWLEWDVDGQRHVVVQHTQRGVGGLHGWQDQPDPLSAADAGLASA